MEMDVFQMRRDEVLAKAVVKGLASRGMSGYFARSKEEALKMALELIPEGSVVAGGGSATVVEIGLVEALEKGNYRFTNRRKLTGEEKLACEIAAYSSDVYIGSVNAVTADGVLVNIDANANRISAYAFGPKKLVLVAGINKVAPDLDSALKRARNEAATVNCQRFGAATPCTRTGKCMDCKAPDTLCCQFLVTRYEKHPGRVHVILVDEKLGY